MAILDGRKAAYEGLLAAAQVGATAAMTAPTVARTPVRTQILTGEDVLPLIEILEILGEMSVFARVDAAVGRKAYEEGIPLVELLIGSEGTLSDLGWNCGACGYNSCAEFKRHSRKNLSRGTTKVGPNCSWKVVDHGIAGSFAAAAISALNIECRLQASYGIAAALLGHLEGCNLGVGITVGPLKESAWFDRVDLKDSFTLAEHEQFVKDTLPQLFVSFCGSGRPQIKHKPDWGAEPKFWKEVADAAFLAKQQEVRARVARVVEREGKKRAGK